MTLKKYAGIISIAIGLLFILFPYFSNDFVSMVIGLSLLFLGISIAVISWNMQSSFSVLILIIGIVAILLGLLFIFYVDALTLIVGLPFYIAGAIMIVLGIMGLLLKVTSFSTASSILFLIIGIIAIGLGKFTFHYEIYSVIIIGFVLIIEGVNVLVQD